MGERKLIRITVWLAAHELAALEIAAKAEKVSRFVRSLILERLTRQRTQTLSEMLLRGRKQDSAQ